MNQDFGGCVNPGSNDRGSDVPADPKNMAHITREEIKKSLEELVDHAKEAEEKAQPALGVAEKLLALVALLVRAGVL